MYPETRTVFHLIKIILPKHDINIFILKLNMYLLILVV